MDTGLQIRVTREGLSQPLNIEECTKAEIIGFFENLDERVRLDWLCFMAGHAVGSAHRIKTLEEQLKEEI